MDTPEQKAILELLSGYEYLTDEEKQEILLQISTEAKKWFNKIKFAAECKNWKPLE